jgi:hypothetical protein
MSSTTPALMGDTVTTTVVATPAAIAFGGRSAKHRVARRAPRTTDGLKADMREQLVREAQAKQAQLLARFDTNAPAAQ